MISIKKQYLLTLFNLFLSITIIGSGKTYLFSLFFIFCVEKSFSNDESVKAYIIFFFVGFLTIKKNLIDGKII